MTTQDSSANPFEYWRDMFQRSIEAWTQAASSAPGGASWPPFFGAAPGAGTPGFNMPGFGQMPGFGAAPGFNPFSQFASQFLTNDIQQVWQQFYNSWAEQAQQAASSGASGPETFLNAQKQWTEQLESMAKMFAEVMGTEAFASMLGRSMMHTLIWQQKAAGQSEPQQDAVLKALNMPSRGQIDRMFERIIGMEDRIDDLEDENRKLRSQVEASLRQPASKPRGRTSETPAGSE